MDWTYSLFAVSALNLAQVATSTDLNADIPGSDRKKVETLIPHKRTIGHKRIYGEVGFDVGEAQQLRLAFGKTLLWFVERHARPTGSYKLSRIIGRASVLHFNIYAEHKRSANELLARKSCDLSAISSSGDPFFGKPS